MTRQHEGRQRRRLTATEVDVERVRQRALLVGTGTGTSPVLAPSGARALSDDVDAASAVPVAGVPPFTGRPLTRLPSDAGVLRGARRGGGGNSRAASMGSGMRPSTCSAADDGSESATGAARDGDTPPDPFGWAATHGHASSSIATTRRRTRIMTHSPARAPPR